MTPEAHLATAEEVIRKYPALAQAHATMAIAKMLAEFPICDHGNRGFCTSCLTMSFIEMGFDQPRR